MHGSIIAGILEMEITMMWYVSTKTSRPGRWQNFSAKRMKKR